MSDTTGNPIREAIAEAIRDHEVILFMKGTPERPACGFSARTVAAPEFASLSRIEQHRRVYAVFGSDIGGPIHALSLETRAE